MRKYTVYEIEKLTDGKLSKYKLTRAIHSGKLKAESVQNIRKGRGTPNFYVYENDLKEFLQQLEKEKNRKIEIYDASDAPQKGIEEINTTIKSLMDTNKLWIENQSYKIDELLNRVQMLEKEQSQILPILKEKEDLEKKEEIRSKQRKELLIELAVETTSETRKKEILSQLNKLA